MGNILIIWPFTHCESETIPIKTTTRKYDLNIRWHRISCRSTLWVLMPPGTFVSLMWCSYLRQVPAHAWHNGGGGLPLLVKAWKISTWSLQCRCENPTKQTNENYTMREIGYFNWSYLRARLIVSSIMYETTTKCELLLVLFSELS